MVSSSWKTFDLVAGPYSSKHDPVPFTVLMNIFVWMLCSHVKTFKFIAGPCSPTSPVTAQFISRRWNLVSFWCCADFQQRSKGRLVVLPQTRSRSFHGVDDFFYLDGMKFFKNVRTYGWVVLPQTRPSFFHGVEEPFRLDVKPSSLWLGRAPQHPLSRPSSFRGVEKSFRFVVMQTFNNVQMNGRLCSPKHDSGYFTVLKNLFCLDGMKLFKNIRAYGWVVLPQTRPSSVHGVEDSICLDVLQPCKNIQVDGWAAFPNITCHGPTQFPALKNRFVLLLCRHSTTFKWTAGRAPPKTVQSILQYWKTISTGWYEAFQKHSSLWLRRAHPNMAQLFSRCGWNSFLWIICSHAKTLKFMAGPHFPTFPVKTQLISRRWRIVSFWCYADNQQRSNEQLVVLPQTRPSSFHGVEEPCHLDGMKLFKDIRIDGWAVLPQTRPSFVHGVETFISIDVLQPCKNIQVDRWAALSNIPCHGPADFAALKNRFVLLLCRLSTLFKWTDGRASPNSVQLISRCWRLSLSKWYEAFQKHSNSWLGCAPPNTAQFVSRCGKPFRLNIKRSSLWLGRAPQQPLSRPSLFRGVKESFRFDVMQTLNNVQMKGFSKKLELMVATCFSKHGPVKFTVLKNFFVWMLCSHAKTFKFMAGPHFPTSSVTAQLGLQRWRIVSLWCCADNQQRSNERLFVLPQTRFSLLLGVKNFSHLDGRKCFKNTRTYGWDVLPQTRPSFFHGVEELFRLDVMQPFKHIQVDGWAALPNFFCHGSFFLSRPSAIRGVEESFGFDVMQTFNNAQMNRRSCSPKHGPEHFTVFKNFFVWKKRSFSKTVELMAGLCFFKHGPVMYTVLKNLYVWMFCSRVKTLKFMAGPRSPTSPVTAQLISRRWRIVLFCSCANFQQRSNERIIVLPQTRSNAFHSLEKLFSSWWYQVFEKHSNLWLGRVPPNTAQFLSRCWGTISSGCYAVM